MLLMFKAKPNAKSVRLCFCCFFLLMDEKMQGISNKQIEEFIVNIQKSLNFAVDNFL